MRTAIAKSSAPIRPSEGISRLLPGLLLTTGLALMATLVNTLPAFNLLSPLILAVVLGIVVRNTVGYTVLFKPGITFTLKRLLRLAIILLGLQLSFVQVAAVGPIGLLIVTVTLVSTFIFTCWLGRQLGVKRQLAHLIAAGTSICGASAVVATSGVVESSDEDAAYAVALVTLFGTLSMLLYPTLDMVLKLSPEAFGLWCGVSIHEVAQVVASAFQVGEVSGDLATISKLSRVIFLVPMLLGLGFLSVRNRKQSEKLKLSQLPIPWFVLGFIALIGFNSLDVFDPAWKNVVVQGNRFLLTIALAAMGLETSLQKVKQSGLKPLYLGGISWIFISGLSLGLITLFY
jgi:uncharacterized integral membrane protein (TIGR00698 family)